MNYKHLTLSALTATLLLSGAHQVQAAGFYIQEQSVKGLGTAFAGSTTSLDDASTVYFNPAGMTKLERMQLNIGVDILAPDAKIKDTGTVNAVGGTNPTGNPYSVTPVPHAFAVVPLEDLTGLPLWAGIGITAPFGLGSDYTDGSFAQFDSTDTHLKTMNIAPSIAYKATDWLSLGAGLDIQQADGNLKSAVFVGGPTSVGESQLTGDDWSFGYNVGLQAKPAFLPNTEIGLHYRSAISHTLEGEVNIAGTGSAADSTQNGEADLDLPDILTFGIAHDITPATRVMGQATWFGWNNFQEIKAINPDTGVTISNVTQNYENTMAFAIGAEHDFNDKLTVRAGYQYDETPTNDTFRTTRTPDGDRNWFSGGASYKLNDAIDLDFAATYIDISKENINLVRNGGVSNISATSEGNVKIFSAGLNYKF